MANAKKTTIITNIKTKIIKSVKNIKISIIKNKVTKSKILIS